VIRVIPQPEPADFDELVRNKGKKFLSKFTTSKLTAKDFLKKDYWSNVRDHMYEAYNGICAYSSHWIPRTSNPNIDHYVPKTVDPKLAYEWSNYRLACSLVNTYKNDFQDVLDPFTLGNDWFFLDFPSLLVRANPNLGDQERKSVQDTINRLRLNNDQFINDRNNWLEAYCLEEAGFTALKKWAPFIAYELERQELIEKIKEMMYYRLEE